MHRGIAAALLLGAILLTAGCLGDAGGTDTDTYRFETATTAEVTLEGAAPGSPGANATVISNQTATGAVDRADREMQVNLTSERTTQGLQGPRAAPGQQSRQRILLANDTVYVGRYTRDGSLDWLRGVEAGVYDQAWQSQDVLSQVEAVLSAANTTRTGQETVRGTEATVHDVEIGAQRYRRVLGETNGSGIAGIGLGPKGSRVRDLAITVWTADDRPVKASIDVEIASNRPTRTGGQQTIVRDAEGTTWFSGFGDPVDVTVPDAARDAMTIAEQRRMRQRQLRNRTANRTVRPDGPSENETTMEEDTGTANDSTDDGTSTGGSTSDGNTTDG